MISELCCDCEPRNAEMITQRLLQFHPSAEAQSSSCLLGLAGVEGWEQLRMKNILKAIIMMANQVQILGPVNFPSLRTGNITECTVMLVFGDIKPPGPNLLGTRHDFIHFVVFWFSWEDHQIINILRLLYNNDGVARTGSRKVFNQKLTVLSEALVRVLVVLCKW